MLVLLISFVLLTMFVLFLIMLRHKKKNKVKTPNFRSIREDLSYSLFKSKNVDCRDVCISSSKGIVHDAVIVCNILKDLHSTPLFHFENYEKSFPMDWLFVNLDCTYFDKIKNDESSPNTICCKTFQAYNILEKFFPNKNVVYTGFTSINRYNQNIKKNYKKFIHIAGKSPAKGTIQLLKTWINHPEWPLLYIVCRLEIEINSRSLVNPSITNIIIISHISDDELNKISNECGVHICTSEYEGFGHSNNEARGVGAVILYTNAPCMNEKFTNMVNGVAVRGYLNGTTDNGYCPKYISYQKDIEESVMTVLNMDEEELKNIGTQARIDFWEDDQKFTDKLLSLVKGYRKIPYIIHYMWISKNDPYIDVELPNKNIKYIKSWKDNNENFEFMYWSGGKIITLIETYFPQYLEFYKNLHPTISKCDFARFIVVAVYGGIYSDIDFMCSKNLSGLLQTETFFIFEPKEHEKKTKSLLNGFFATCPNHEFVLGWLYEMSNKHINGHVLENTGPIGLYDYYKKTTNGINICGNMCLISPITNKQQVSDECKNKEFDMYMHTGWNDGSGW